MISSVRLSFYGMFVFGLQIDYYLPKSSVITTCILIDMCVVFIMYLINFSSPADIVKIIFLSYIFIHLYCMSITLIGTHMRHIV